MPKNALTSLEVRKLIVKLLNEDKHSIGEIANIAQKSKSIIHGILKKFEETGSREAKKSPGISKKITAKTDLPKFFEVLPLTLRWLSTPQNFALPQIYKNLTTAFWLKMHRRPKFISAPIQLFLLTTSHKQQISKNDVFDENRSKNYLSLRNCCKIHVLAKVISCLLAQIK